MLNFSKLKLVVGAKDSFVGIRQSESEEVYEFCLPHGFEDFLDHQSDFNKVRDFFFLMYRTLRKFDKDNDSTNRFNRKDSKSQSSQDQPALSTGGSTLENEEGGECILYSKLTMIERVLEAYDDLAIHSIQKKIRRTDEIDYSQLYRYLDRAIYLEDDVIYIDVMDLPRPSIRHESTDIVNLYCFILNEIIQQLQEDVPDHVKGRSQDIQFLGQRFREDYLTSSQSLFDEETFEETITLLREALDDIDRNTHYKDADYWGLFEAVETFLYGQFNSDQEDGEFWGIKGQQGFSLVWEDMCQTYFFKENFNPTENKFNNIFFADTDIPIEGYDNKEKINPNFQRPEIEKNRVGNFNKENNREHRRQNYTETQWLYQVPSNIDHPYAEYQLKSSELLCIEWDINYGSFDDQQNIQRSSKKPLLLLRRFPKPDLVLADNLCDLKHLKIIDFKNVSLDFYRNNVKRPLEETPEKYQTDLGKQLAYELALQQSFPDASIESQFFIPFYYSNSSPPNEPLGEEYESLEVRGIKIFKGNFYFIQSQYLDV